MSSIAVARSKQRLDSRARQERLRERYGAPLELSERALVVVAMVLVWAVACVLSLLRR